MKVGKGAGWKYRTGWMGGEGGRGKTQEKGERNERSFFCDIGNKGTPNQEGGFSYSKFHLFFCRLLANSLPPPAIWQKFGR